ncbi:avidin/streptavidin family protein [Psychromonas antarctica]|uniref:avidin/streptavidin family protein n=1 Tax=Psychromonas antarctica TaxID=67573 RepID=UPI001EE804A3|nr:avidin/streptavidin family protein [Psychromonas antarctica]MCG6201058.1 avidin/streptavidin family protein [Psychromonas antarctica]
MNDNLTGTWLNTFGSEMSLMVKGSTIFGTYVSQTGSSGEYLLVGSCSVDNPSKDFGQSIAIAIYWNNIEGGVKDDSCHWVGSMCGQLQLDGQMILTNSIVVSVPFESYQKSNYIDELLFTKVKNAQQAHSLFSQKSLFELQSATNIYPIVGRWVSLYDDIILTIGKVDARSGLTQATLAKRESEVQLLGFIDVNAQVNMAQGITLSGYCSVTKETCSLSGMLNYGSDHLTLYSWMARPTSAQDRFMQTRMDSIILQKNNS